MFIFWQELSKPILIHFGLNISILFLYTPVLQMLWFSRDFEMSRLPRIFLVQFVRKSEIRHEEQNEDIRPLIIGKGRQSSGRQEKKMEDFRGSPPSQQSVRTPFPSSDPGRSRSGRRRHFCSSPPYRILRYTL